MNIAALVVVMNRRVNTGTFELNSTLCALLLAFVLQGALAIALEAMR